MKNMWVLYNEVEDQVLEFTVASTKNDCWQNSYPHVAHALGEEWEKKYWKKWDPSIRSAEKNGFKIRKCRLVLEKEEK